LTTITERQNPLNEQSNIVKEHLNILTELILKIKKEEKKEKKEKIQIDISTSRSY
jgi:hypothetical protein